MSFESVAGATAAATAGTATIGGATVTIESQRGRVYVGGLPPDTTEDAVTSALSGFGPVTSVAVTGTSAFVAFGDVTSATKAIGAGSVSVGGTLARIEAPRPRRRRVGAE